MSAIGAALLTLASVGALAAGPSPIILPKPSIPLNFSHSSHAGKLGMKCLACHGGAMKSIDSADSLLPRMELCVTCHNVKAPNPEKAFPKASCETCHPGWHKGDEGKPLPVVLAVPRLRFTHRAHALLGIICSTCHEGVERQTAPSAAGWGEHMPTMAVCVTCHNGSDAPSACSTCHLAEDDGRLITRFPEGKLSPIGRFHDDDHRDPAWSLRHGPPARDSGYCASCHTESSCLECHAGATSPREIHPGNFIVLHARDALVNTADCMGCHEGGVGCQKCHEATGMNQAAAEGKTGTPKASRQIHPRGWADLVPGPNHHAMTARTAMATCVSCHTEDECIRCHSDQTLRVNPHGSGFKGGILQSRNNASCKKCHPGGIP